MIRSDSLSDEFGSFIVIEHGLEFFDAYSFFFLFLCDFVLEAVLEVIWIRHIFDEIFAPEELIVMIIFYFLVVLGLVAAALEPGLIDGQTSLLVGGLAVAEQRFDLCLCFFVLGFAEPTD